MLDPKLKAEWVADLRSGKHRQVSGYLHKGDAYCCLGRLYEVMGVEPIAEWVPWQSNPKDVVYSYGDQTSMLSEDVLREAGLDAMHAIDLSEINDRGASFAEIADRIEQNKEI